MREVKCYVCGKSFILSSANVYRARINHKVTHLCSWSCFQTVQAEIEEAKEKRNGNR